MNELSFERCSAHQTFAVIHGTKIEKCVASEQINWLGLDQTCLSEISFLANRVQITHLLWPWDSAQSLNLLNLLEARLADGHRKV